MQLNPAQPEFLDLLGHELRIPITAMRGQIQLLQRRLRREGGRDDDLTDLDRILFQVDRTNRALEIILAAAHIQQGELAMLPCPRDLVGVVERQVASYNAGSKAHNITLDQPSQPLVAEFDQSRIELALDALLSNALKYGTGGEIHVRVVRVGERARVEVCDSGRGIPASDRRRIFQLYGRGSNVENAGLGLGLYVARAIVQAHGGRIGVRNTPGGGSTFWFTLPRSKEQAAD